MRRSLRSRRSGHVLRSLLRPQKSEISDGLRESFALPNAGGPLSPRPLSVPPNAALQGRFAPCWLGADAPWTEQRRAGMEGAGRSATAADVSTAGRLRRPRSATRPPSRAPRGFQHGSIRCRTLYISLQLHSLYPPTRGAVPLVTIDQVLAERDARVAREAGCPPREPYPCHCPDAPREHGSRSVVLVRRHQNDCPCVGRRHAEPSPPRATRTRPSPVVSENPAFRR
jgi:hypothetical protein